MNWVTRVEHGPIWFLGRLFIPGRLRVAACQERGEHHPEIIEMGRSKMCRACGGW